ncbi:AIR synthase family protein [Lachnospiraceae bacterium ZAX-1]
MKVGKISESILKRSVFKQIRTVRPEVVLGAGVGEDCAAMQLKADEIFVVSTDPITGTAVDIGHLAIHITLNDLSSCGAEPVGVLLTILLPEDATEADLKEMMKQIEDVCAIFHVQIMGGHTEVTKAVNQPVITVCGIGKAKEGQLVSTSGVKPGQDIIVSKWIGLEGTSIIAKKKEEELLSRYPNHMVDTAKGFDQYMSVLPEAAVAMKFGVCAMHDVTEGGIFGALWEMAEASGIGLCIDLKKIPVRQETIEVCEFYGISPYELISSGCMLMAVDNGSNLVHEIEKAGIKASVIGKAVSGKDRILMNEEEKRFLEPPKTDELYKVLG